MMYCAPEPETLGHSISDEDLEKWNWFILLDQFKGIRFRIITTEQPQ